MALSAPRQNPDPGEPGSLLSGLEASWNVMAHAQKPDFVFRRNGWVHLNRLGASVQSTTGSRGVRINGSNAGYTMFRGSVKCTGYLLHSPLSPLLPIPCVSVCHHISTGLHSLVRTLAARTVWGASTVTFFKGWHCQRHAKISSWRARESSFRFTIP